MFTRHTLDEDKAHSRTYTLYTLRLLSCTFYPPISHFPLKIWVQISTICSAGLVYTGCLHTTYSREVRGPADLVAAALTAVLQCCSGHVTRPPEVTGTSYRQPRSRDRPISWGPPLYYQLPVPYFISIIIGGAGTGPGVAPYHGCVDQNIRIWQQISTAS